MQSTAHHLDVTKWTDSLLALIGWLDNIYELQDLVLQILTYAGLSPKWLGTKVGS